MSITLTVEEIINNAVGLNRVHVRIIEAADVLLDHHPAWTERLLLRLVRGLYTRRLRGLVAALPSDITSEILAASEKMTGVVRGFTDN